MRKYISSIPAKTVTDAITAAVTGAMSPAFTPFKISLTNEEKLGMRTFATEREGYVRLVSRIASSNPNALGRSDNATELAALLDYFNNLESARLALAQAMEVIQETQLGVSGDAMTLTDRYVQNLQISRANDAALDIAMQEVDDYNKRFANKPNADPTGGTGGNNQ
jgi:hypothetical protein